MRLPLRWRCAHGKHTRRRRPAARELFVFMPCCCRNGFGRDCDLSPSVSAYTRIGPPGARGGCCRIRRQTRFVLASAVPRTAIELRSEAAPSFGALLRPRRQRSDRGACARERRGCFGTRGRPHTASAGSTGAKYKPGRGREDNKNDFFYGAWHANARPRPGRNAARQRRAGDVLRRPTQGFWRPTFDTRVLVSLPLAAKRTPSMGAGVRHVRVRRQGHQVRDAARQSGMGLRRVHGEWIR